MITNGEKFRRFIVSEAGGEYELLGEYVNSSTKVRMRHLSCNHVYDVTPNKFQQGRRCPKCAIRNRGRARRKTNEEFLREVTDLVGDEYVFLEEYKGMFTKIKVVHKRCGYAYTVLPSNFIYHGHRCPGRECLRERKSRSQRMSQAEFEVRVRDLVGEEYEVLGKYRNFVTPVELMHNVCGHRYSVTPGNFLHHEKRCPKCIFSRGEKRVERFLSDKGYSYKSQVRFSDCTLKRPLVFDFIVYDREGTPTHAIEYDGEFHFHQKFRTDGEFALQKIRDLMKDRYCEYKGIEMVRIPYYHFDDIEKILQESLPKYDNPEPSALEIA